MNSPSIYLSILIESLFPTQGALRITSLSLRDHGVYTCVAGRSSANLTLVVKPRPGEFPSSEEIERHNKALDEPSSPLADRCV